jgi:hypothetical protein
MPNAFSSYAGITGSALTDLAGGFGGDQLRDQSIQETDEERKKRLRMLRMESGSGSALGSLGAQALFGSYGR